MARLDKKYPLTKFRIFPTAFRQALGTRGRTAPERLERERSRIQRVLLHSLASGDFSVTLRFPGDVTYRHAGDLVQSVLDGLGLGQRVNWESEEIRGIAQVRVFWR